MGREHPPTDAHDAAHDGAHDDGHNDEKALHDLGQAGSVIQHAIKYLM